MNPVIGRAFLNIGDEVRELACDMRCVAVLWDEVGDEWAAWLSERFAGTLMEAEGKTVRMAAQIPAADLGVALFALLASDRARRPRIETPETIVEALGERAVEAQGVAMNAIAPSFGIEGKGLERERKRRKSKPKPWDWRLVLETALGLMGLKPDVFWSMTLAEWRAAHDGFAAREKRRMRSAAWVLSYQLTAAGCDADKVTPAKLLGEREPKKRVRRSADGEPKLPIDKLYEVLKSNGGFGGAKPAEG